MISSGAAEKINHRLERVDHDIGCARAAIGRQEAADAVRWIMRAASDKHRVLEFCTPGFVDVYDMFFYADLVERAATLWPDEVPDLDDVIEQLEQSLADIEFALEDGAYLEDTLDRSDADAMKQRLQDIASWLRDAIKGFKKNPPEKPAHGAISQAKTRYLDALDPTGELTAMYEYLEGMNLNFWFATGRLAENPPDFTGADHDLTRAEELKHKLMNRLRKFINDTPQPPSDSDDPNQGVDPVPPRTVLGGSWG